MKRSKVISIRVNEELYNKFQAIVSKQTRVWFCYKKRKMYDYRDLLIPYEYQYDKFSVADLLELSMRRYVEEREALVEEK